MKNCGDYVHVQIAERNILGEMVKIVRKKVSLEDVVVWQSTVSYKPILVLF